MLSIIGATVIGTLFFGSCVVAIIISIADGMASDAGEESFYDYESYDY